MSNSLPTNGNFEPAEMHISNKAYRDFLLHDEQALFDEDGTFNEVGMVIGMMAHLYEEEDGPKRLQEILKRMRMSSSKKIPQSS
jgi:hypothetical protein